MCNSGYFLSYVDGLGTSYARSFLASTNARFYKELGAVYMKAGLARLARQPGKRDLALLLFF